MKDPKDSELLHRFAKTFEDDPDKRFGPLWNDGEFVLKCLRKYLVEEGHSVRESSTVSDLAEYFIYDPYAPDWNEIQAVIRLLQLGMGGAVICSRIGLNGGEDVT